MDLEKAIRVARSCDYACVPYFVASGGTDTLVLQENSSISHAGHNSAGLGQRIAFLTETRGIRLGDQHFQRRAVAGLLAAETILRSHRQRGPCLQDR